MTIRAFSGSLNDDDRALVFGLYTAVFGADRLGRLESRWPGCMQAQGLTLVAFDKAQPLGFKSGYALPEEGVFYSWLGGVLPAYRRQGIGQLLLDAQHDWCRQQGFRVIRTKTLNRWKSMLLLNLRNGFDITGTYADENGVLKILLEKHLV